MGPVAREAAALASIHPLAHDIPLQAIVTEQLTHTGETTELLRTLIRNACVNDGTPESGHETRSVDLLAQYVGDTGLAMDP